MKPRSIAFLGALLASQFPFQALSQTIADISRVLPPIIDRVSPVMAGDQVMRSSPFGDFTITESETTGHILGFSFNNIGPNRIIPVPATDIGTGPDREFHFRFQSRARQDIYFSVTDTPDEYLSNRMESYLYLFPRHNLPAIELVEGGAKGEELKVTLPNGEEIVFDAKTKEILRGVFREKAPLDQNPDRFKRKFAALEYSGSSTLIRVNRRGGDPRLGTTATLTQGKRTCKIPSSLLFDQDPSSDVNFLFPTDDGLNTLMLKKCGFGLQ